MNSRNIISLMLAVIIGLMIPVWFWGISMESKDCLNFGTSDCAQIKDGLAMALHHAGLYANITKAQGRVIFLILGLMVLSAGGIILETRATEAREKFGKKNKFVPKAVWRFREWFKIKQTLGLKFAVSGRNGSN